MVMARLSVHWRKAGYAPNTLGQLCASGISNADVGPRRRHWKPEEVDSEWCSVCSGAVGQLGNQARTGGTVAQRGQEPTMFFW